MYLEYIMKRTQIYLDEEQDRALEARARQTGVTKSSLIRDAIAEFLAPEDREEIRLQRLKAAVAEAAGIAPYLPPGEQYVEELRALGARRQEELDRQWHG